MDIVERVGLEVGEENLLAGDVVEQSAALALSAAASEACEAVLDGVVGLIALGAVPGDHGAGDGGRHVEVADLAAGVGGTHGQIVDV